MKTKFDIIINFRTFSNDEIPLEDLRLLQTVNKRRLKFLNMKYKKAKNLGMLSNVLAFISVGTVIPNFAYNLDSSLLAGLTLVAAGTSAVTMISSEIKKKRIEIETNIVETSIDLFDKEINSREQPENQLEEEMENE